MQANKNLNVTEPESSLPTDPYAPRNLTFAENAMLTVKVLGALVLIGALVWGVNFWTSPK